MQAIALFLFFFFFSFLTATTPAQANCLCGENGAWYGFRNESDMEHVSEYPLNVINVEPICDMGRVDEPIVGCYVTLELVTEAHYLINTYDTGNGKIIFYLGEWYTFEELNERITKHGCSAIPTS